MPAPTAPRSPPHFLPQYFWFEVFEVLRKLFLSAVVVFIYNGSPTQILIAQFAASMVSC